MISKTSHAAERASPLAFQGWRAVLVVVAIALDFALLDTFLSSRGTFALRFWPISADLTFPFFIIPLAGVIAGVLSTIAIWVHSAQIGRMSAMHASVLLLVLATGVSAWSRQIPLPNAVLLALFGGIAIIASSSAIDAFTGGDGFEVRSNWGGLGGGMGGWRLSPAASLTILASAAALLAAAAVMQERGREGPASGDVPAKSTASANDPKEKPAGSGVQSQRFHAGAP